MDRLLTVPEAAEVLNVSKPRAYELIRMCVIPHVRIGRQVRVPAEQLAEFIRSGGRPLMNAA